MDGVEAGRYIELEKEAKPFIGKRLMNKISTLPHRFETDDIVSLFEEVYESLEETGEEYDRNLIAKVNHGDDVSPYEEMESLLEQGVPLDELEFEVVNVSSAFMDVDSVSITLTYKPGYVDTKTVLDGGPVGMPTPTKKEYVESHDRLWAELEFDEEVGLRERVDYKDVLEQRGFESTKDPIISTY